MKKTTKTIKIGEKIIEFKDEIRGLDFIAGLDEKQRMVIDTQVRLIATASQNPKLSQKDILMMPYHEFMQLLAQFSKIYSLDQKFDFLEQK